MYSEVVEEKRHVDALELFRHMTQACRRTLGHLLDDRNYEQI